MNRLLTSSDRWRLTLLGGCLALLALFQPLTSITIAPATFAPPILLIAFVGALGLIYRLLSRDEGIAATCFALSQLLLFSNCAALLNYLGLALRRPLNDTLLAAGRPRARTGLVGLCGLAKVQSVCRPGHHSGL